MLLNTDRKLSPARIKVLETYIHVAKNIVREAYNQTEPQDLRLVWSGHKDSTLTLWIWKEVCQEYGLPLPKAVTLDEGDNFTEVEEFLSEISKDWGLELDVASNVDVLKACGYQLGADVQVKDLNERNRQEIERIGLASWRLFRLRRNLLLATI